MASIDRKAIVILGDSLSDMDGVGQKGFGPGRWQHAVWTRELSMQIDTGQWTGRNRGTEKKYKKYRSFHLSEGGDTEGGREFAVSGSTSRDNLARLKSSLKQTKPGLIVIAGTGFTDFNKKISLSETIKNVTEMVRLAKAAGSKVMLIGFPPRDPHLKDALSIAEQNTVNALKTIANREGVPLVADYFAPLRVNGVVQKKYLMDGIHVKSDRTVQKKLLANIMTKMEPLLKSLAPVVVDLTGEGLRFNSLAKSNASYDGDHDGQRDAVAWVQKGMGILGFDKQGDGRISETDEISFVSYKPGAKTDLEGLQAFDTNGDSKLSKDDADWRKFVIWVDANGNGVSDAGELKTLDQLGVASISLVSDHQAERRDGVTIHGKSTFTMTDGTTRTSGDVSFDYIASSEGAAINAKVHTLRHAMAGGPGRDRPGELSSFGSSRSAGLDPMIAVSR